MSLNVDQRQQQIADDYREAFEATYGQKRLVMKWHSEKGETVGMRVSIDGGNVSTMSWRDLEEAIRQFNAGKIGHIH